jgi:two-component system, NarL family, nitrate/nitrite response regulator NarL
LTGVERRRRFTGSDEGGWGDAFEVAAALEACRNTARRRVALGSGGLVMIRVLIVAEVRLYREGLAEVFAREDDVAVIATAAGVAEAFAAAVEARPDVTLVDLGAPGGVAVARGLSEAVPATKVIALAVREVEEEVVALAEAGVTGYVTRDQSLDELRAAVRSVAAGETLCSPWLAATLLRRVAELARDRTVSGDAARLTVREREIVGLIDDGLSNKEIARRLTIELSTVKNHVHNILEKLHVERRSEAAAAARANRI